MTRMALRPHLDETETAESDVSYPMFDTINPRERPALLALKTAQRRRGRDAPLVRAGDDDTPLLTLLDGWAFRYKLLSDGRRQILGVLLPGDTVGVDTLFAGASDVSVQTASEVSYCVLNRDLAREMVATMPWFRDRVIGMLVQDRVVAEEWLTRLGQCSAEERIASLLVDLYRRLERRELASSGTFVLELTQQQIADIVGLTTIHVNRVLRRLREQGLLATTGQRVTLHDMPNLEYLSPLRSKRQDSHAAF